MLSKSGQLKLLLSIAFVVVVSAACSSGFTEEEVRATADAAFDSGVESARAKPFLEVTSVYIVGDSPTIRSRCESSGLDFPCGGVTWTDGSGNRQSNLYSPDSRCHKEAKIGYDLPESCR